MRANVRNAWENVVCESVEVEFPRFMQEPKKKIGDSGMLRFAWHARSSLWLLLAFRPLDDEAFDVFAGWSTKRTVPFAKFFDSNPKNIHDFSLEYFLTWTLNFVPRQGLSYWKFWEPPEEALDDPDLFIKLDNEHYQQQLSPEEARALVSPKVAQAIQEIKDYCMPYFEKRIAFEDNKNKGITH